MTGCKHYIHRDCILKAIATQRWHFDFTNANEDTIQRSLPTCKQCDESLLDEEFNKVQDSIDQIEDDKESEIRRNPKIVEIRDKLTECKQRVTDLKTAHWLQHQAKILVQDLKVVEQKFKDNTDGGTSVDRSHWDEEIVRLHEYHQTMLLLAEMDVARYRVDWVVHDESKARRKSNRFLKAVQDLMDPSQVVQMWAIKNQPNVEDELSAAKARNLAEKCLNYIMSNGDNTGGGTSFVHLSHSDESARLWFHLECEVHDHNRYDHAQEARKFVAEKDSEIGPTPSLIKEGQAITLYVEAEGRHDEIIKKINDEVAPQKDAMQQSIAAGRRRVKSW